VSRKRLAALVLAIVTIALVLGLPALQTKSSRAASSEVPGAAPAAATSAYEYMAELSDEIGPRVAGTPAEARTAGRISQWFAQLGYEPALQDFAFKDGGASLNSANVIATKTGSSPQQIVIGAHYDSVKVGRGAFDNASGVALLMQLADALRAEETPYTLVFVAFGAEEAGLKGSKAYFDSMTAAQKAATVLMINFDSVATGDQVYCYSSAAEAWPQLALRSMARQMGATILTSPGLNKDYPYGTTGDWSDHAVFAKNGVPYLYLEATNWLLGDKDGYINSVKYGEIWHSQKDTISYIEQQLPGRMQAQLELEFAALAQFLTTYSH
jgi:alkaline phosphatase isozyme conversion protein